LPPLEEADVSAEAIAAAFRSRLAEVAQRESEQAVTLVGPHRDDFAFRLDGVDLNTFGSRGQQRLAVLALKLCEAEYMRSQTDEQPILLLDDVLSELDPRRRAYVLARVTNDGQTLLTATDPADLGLGYQGRARFYRVQNGAVAEV
ncbi:MAG: DNA replication and repair protein RecF, partial [Chloroflexi bacterium]|nr:DNA replication and repair protein RecF [Chloroflexota bacterium]